MVTRKHIMAELQRLYLIPKITRFSNHIHLLQEEKTNGYS